MRSFWSWVTTKFWWLWSANLLAAFVVVFFFVLGWVHETITAPNLPAWCVILSIVPALLAVSVGLRATRHSHSAVALLLFIPLATVLWIVGGLLLGILYFLVSCIGYFFGHGRVN